MIKGRIGEGKFGRLVVRPDSGDSACLSLGIIVIYANGADPFALPSSARPAFLELSVVYQLRKFQKVGPRGLKQPGSRCRNFLG